MRRHRRGFSVIELLVALTIAVIVAAIMLATMRAVWKLVHSWQAAAGSPDRPLVVAA